MRKGTRAAEVTAAERIFSLQESLGELLLSAEVRVRVQSNRRVLGAHGNTSCACPCGQAKNKQGGGRLRSYGAMLYGARLLLHSKLPSVGKLNENPLAVTNDLSAVILVRHMHATPHLTSSNNSAENKRNGQGKALSAFMLSHPDGRAWRFEMKNDAQVERWTSTINSVAAWQSPRPLPPHSASKNNLVSHQFCSNPLSKHTATLLHYSCTTLAQQYQLVGVVLRCRDAALS